MSFISRQQYLTRVFTRLHDRISEIYEDVFDGDVEPAKNNINSTIAELKELKKNIEP